MTTWGILSVDIPRALSGLVVTGLQWGKRRFTRPRERNRLYAFFELPELLELIWLLPVANASLRPPDEWVRVLDPSRSRVFVHVFGQINALTLNVRTL